ncbi:Ap1g1 [Symbiodinium necroappetens]|uniref:Ap1g1 protein n=1 Tax=Symbiodinium necroappetens TaxID=1628268 RepID=A0A812J105_9DINO|nr:Ap1g1 [Symbiodinium necroappetens]
MASPALCSHAPQSGSRPKSRFVLALLAMICWQMSRHSVSAFLPGFQGRRLAIQAALVGLVPQAAKAEEGAPVKKGGRASKWYGIYEDPKHPSCDRSIVIAFDGTKGKIEGYDLSGAGDEGKFNCRKRRDVQYYDWSLKVSLANKDANELVVEQAGRDIVDRKRIGQPSEVIAKWDGDGILWPDGTKWPSAAVCPVFRDGDDAGRDMSRCSLQDGRMAGAPAESAVTFSGPACSSARDDREVHRDSRIMSITFNPHGSRCVTTDNNGVVGVWKTDMRGLCNQMCHYRKTGAHDKVIFRTMTPSGEPNLDNPPFFFGGEQGIIYLADDFGLCSERYKIGSPLLLLEYYREKAPGTRDQP